MPTLIKLSETAEEMIEIFEFRHSVLSSNDDVQLPEYFGKIKKVSDYLDSLPSTINVTAYCDGRVIGTMRSCLYNPELDLHNETFDFSESHKEISEDCQIIDVCMFEKNIFSKNLFYQMYKLMINKLYSKRVSHLFLVLPKEFLESLDLISFVDLNTNRSINLRPGIVNVHESYLNYFESIIQNKVFNFREVFSRIIFYPGEFLMLEGEKGNSAFLIDEGSVEILNQVNGQVISIGILDKGKIVGEVAMLTGEERTASIMASQETTVLSFERNEFMDFLYKDPSKALDIFKIFSSRLTSSYQELKKAKEQLTT